jgi:hypothetical protein
MKILKVFLLTAILSLVTCTSRRPTVDKYHHKNLQQTTVVFIFGKGKTATRDTVKILYWDYLLFFSDAVTDKDTVVICEGYTKYKILSDSIIDYRQR